jgi:UDP-N-acetylmuramate dehydrogenase
MDRISKKIETYHIARHSYQDFTFPNLGSMISMRRNIYEDILSKDTLYAMLFWILKLVLKNPVVKFINRKRPSNIAFNYLLLRYLTKVKNINLKKRMSNKGANILINDGVCSTGEIVSYIFLMHELTNYQYHIENEVIVEPVYSIDEGFVTAYDEIKKIMKCKK